MKIALLGAAGQLGKDLAPRLRGEVVPLTRAECDLTNPDRLRDTLADIRPDVVVNCAAYNLVDQAESTPEAAFAVNTFAVRSLAQVCDSLGCLLVQYSTDYVFGLDAGRSTPWTEADGPGPVSVYGTSKLAGEYAVRATCERHLVIRTCGLYGVWGVGGKGGNFVETMLKLAEVGKPLRIVGDQRCTPSYTADVAEASARLIERGTTGLLHLTNAGDCTWFEFASEIFRLAGSNVEVSAITSKEFGRPAGRPPYSALALDRLADEGVTMRDWRDALAAYLRERTQR